MVQAQGLRLSPWDSSLQENLQVVPKGHGGWTWQGWAGELSNSQPLE